MYHSLIGKPSLRVVLFMGLLIGLCSLLLLAACGGGNSAKGGAGQEHKKKEIGSLRVENASGDSATANSGQIVGERRGEFLRPPRPRLLHRRPVLLRDQESRADGGICSF
jgi:hypothetical protein